MEKNGFKNFLILGISIGLGLAIAGISISVSFYQTRVTQRVVTVKGLAERNVDADLAIWPLTFMETGNDLSALYSTIQSKRKIMRTFLLNAGFDANEISQSAPSIRDTQAEPVYGSQSVPKYRYTAQQTISVRTGKVQLVKQVMEKSGELVGQGIVLVSGGFPDFRFTSLNAIKPEMIAEATKNAREAAEQFARDSGSKVGKIKYARQGLFSIDVRDYNSPDYKVVRVVNSIEYFIVD